MKLFLIFLLFASFVLVAIFVYMYYLVRQKLFFDLVYICRSLKNNISFNKNQINDLLTNIFKQINKTSRYIIKKNKLSFSNYFLKNDKKKVIDFFKSIGHGDVNFEINNLNYYENIFVEIENKSKDKLQKKGLMYFKLIIGIGIIICILLF